MELKEFVKKTLLEIVEGVEEAQKAVKEHGAVVNPKYVKGDSAQIGREYVPVQDISFEVGLTTSEVTGNDKGIGVVLGPLKAGINGTGNTSESSVTRIKFTVPLALPVDAASKDNKVISYTGMPIIESDI